MGGLEIPFNTERGAREDAVLEASKTASVMGEIFDKKTDKIRNVLIATDGKWTEEGEIWRKQQGEKLKVPGTGYAAEAEKETAKGKEQIRKVASLMDNPDAP